MMACKIAHCECAFTQFITVVPGPSNLPCFVQEPLELAQTQPLSACKGKNVSVIGEPETADLSVSCASAPCPSIF